MKFDGIDDGVHIPNSNFINVNAGPFSNRTIIAVFNCDDVKKKGKQTIFEEGGRTRGFVIYVFEGQLYVGGWNRAEYQWNPGSWLSASINSNQWYTVSLIIRDSADAQEDGKFEMWLDGNFIDSAVGGQIHNHPGDNDIGYTNVNTVFHDDDGEGDARDFFGGAIDEVWILNIALSETDLGAWVGKVPYAFSPNPADRAVHEDTWITLEWTAGYYAVSHDVYFGDNFDDVNEGTGGTFLGNQADTYLVVGFPGFPYPDGLQFGTTYYWRVDEFDTFETHNRECSDFMHPFSVKDKDERFIQLPTETLDLLTEYQQEASEGVPYILLTKERYIRVLKRWHNYRKQKKSWRNRYMINHVNRDFKAHAKRAGLQFNGKFTIHTFRKTCAQNWADYLPANVVKFYLGHSDMNTTNRFYSIVDESHTQRTKRVMDQMLNGKIENRLDTRWTLASENKKEKDSKKKQVRSKPPINPAPTKTSNKSKNRGDRT